MADRLGGVLNTEAGRGAKRGGQTDRREMGARQTVGTTSVYGRTAEEDERARQDAQQIKFSRAIREMDGEGAPGLQRLLRRQPQQQPQ